MKHAVIVAHPSRRSLNAAIAQTYRKAVEHLGHEVVERYGIGVDSEGAFDDDEAGWPGGDLDVFADDGLPHEELRTIVTADDLWADLERGLG